jgi:predicted nucleic acid-binding protein
MYLLDTNVLSETRRRVPHPRVLAWIESVPERWLHTSVLVIGEIQRGVQHRVHSDRAAAQLDEVWLGELIDLYGLEDRIVTVGLQDVLAWGRITAGGKVPHIDGLLAAQALVRGWTVVTRNTKDFEPTGVRIINPFAYEA